MFVTKKAFDKFVNNDFVHLERKVESIHSVTHETSGKIKVMIPLMVGVLVATLTALAAVVLTSIAL